MNHFSWDPIRSRALSGSSIFILIMINPGWLSMMNTHVHGYRFIWGGLHIWLITQDQCNAKQCKHWYSHFCDYTSFQSPNNFNIKINTLHAAVFVHRPRATLHAAIFVHRPREIYILNFYSKLTTIWPFSSGTAPLTQLDYTCTRMSMHSITVSTVCRKLEPWCSSLHNSYTNYGHAQHVPHFPYSIYPV